MKKIYVMRLKRDAEPDKSAVEAELAVVNGTATAHTITDAADLTGVAKLAEKALENAGIPRDLRPGASVKYMPSGPAAKAYRNYVITTSVTLVRNTQGWMLTECVRGITYPRTPERFDVDVSLPAAIKTAETALAAVGWSLEYLDVVRRTMSERAADDVALAQIAAVA